VPRKLAALRFQPHASGPLFFVGFLDFLVESFLDCLLLRKLRPPLAVPLGTFLDLLPVADSLADFTDGLNVFAESVLVVPLGPVPFA